jgi:hypothetical protein
MRYEKDDYKDAETEIMKLKMMFFDIQYENKELKKQLEYLIKQNEKQQKNIDFFNEWLNDICNEYLQYVKKQ